MSNVKDINNSASWGFTTRQVQVGQEQPDPATDARAVPIYASTSFVFHDSQHAADRFGLRDAGNIYGRLTNPTQDIFEKRIASLEGGTAALATASGAAAINYTIQALAKSGEHIVASKTIYGGTYNLLAHTLPLTSGITTTFVDPEEEGAFEAAITDKTKALYVETLGNPNSNIADLEALAKIAHSHGIPLVVDSTFATPYLVRPIEYGADIVVHSATKFIGGHGTAIGGVIIESGNYDWKASGKFPWISEPNPSYHRDSFADAAPGAAFVTYIRAILLRDTGSTLSPFHAFIFLQGLDLIVQTGSTLPIDLILQDISALIMRCSLYKFPIKFDCFLKIMSSGSNLRHLIKKHSSHRCAVISNIKNLHTVLIPFNGLVKIRHNIKHIQILDPAPVNGIRNLDCCLIIFLFYEFFYLLRFQAIFILIQ